MQAHWMPGLKPNPIGRDSIQGFCVLLLAFSTGMGLLACAPDDGAGQGFADAEDPQAESGELAFSESSPGPLLLMDRLAEAQIKSPLLGLDPAMGLEELEGSSVEVLLDEGFEDFEWQPVNSVGSAYTSVVPGNGGSVLQLTNFVMGCAPGWVFPADVDSFYEFERSVNVLGKSFCDVFLVESMLEPDEARPDSRTHFLEGLQSALKVHSFPLQSGSAAGGAWQHARTSFQPTARTRSLVLLFRSNIGVDPRATLRSMSFDDLRLKRVSPTPQERIQLLKAAHAAPGASSKLGMQKSGLLLPLSTPSGRQDGQAPEANYDWRNALYAPPGTEIAFELRLPQEAHLRLATGLARETPTKAAARFQVELTCDDLDGTVSLLDQVCIARMEEWKWYEHDFDLSAWAGRSVKLVLRTLAENGDAHPLWANPRIEKSPEQKDPLVILIAVDTLRADRLGSYGYGRPTSPAMDRFAQDAVRFDQARANSNWTCPSFASIFTGMVPSRHGVIGDGSATPLPNEMLTMAERFKQAGWSARSIIYKVQLFNANFEKGFEPAFNVPRGMIRGEENLAWALEWLRTRPGGPSFLFLHFNDPHQPFCQPEPYDRTFGKAPDELGYSWPLPIPKEDQLAEQRVAIDLYDGAVAYVDSCIGRFLDALRSADLYDQATIALVADHGEQLWDHGKFGHGGAVLYDEVVHVPLIIKPAASMGIASTVISSDVSAFDVMPTLLELAGIQALDGLDARSLVPLMKGEVERLDRSVFIETSSLGLAVVEYGFKYMLSPGGQAERLFDLQKDVAEANDIAGEAPEILGRMRALAIDYILKHRTGRFLLMQAGESAASLTASTRSIRVLVGKGVTIHEADDPSSSKFALGANKWCLLEVEDPNPESVVLQGLATRGEAKGYAPWIERSLPTLKGPGIWRVKGPDAVRRAPDPDQEPEAQVVDEEMQEALRQLGYVE